jgi:serine protease AprX
VRGIGFVSGQDVDPAGVTNGWGAPGTIAGKLSFLDGDGYSGLADIANHPNRQAIEYAVANRLVDGHADGRFRPDFALKRSELAKYLVMGANIRQQLPLNNTPTFTDVATGTSTYAYAESAAARGGSLRDITQVGAPVMGVSNGKFLPDAAVTRVSAAYSLVQAMAMEGPAKAFTGDITAFHMGQRVPVLDQANISPSLRGYVQYALDLGLLDAKFATVGGQTVAYFEPGKSLTRAQYAIAAARFSTVFRQAEDE